MYGQFATGHEPLAQTGGQFEVGGQSAFQRKVCSNLGGSKFLGVEAYAGIDLCRLAVASHEHDAHVIPVGQYLILGCLIKQIHAHRGGQAIQKLCVDAVAFAQMELLADESLVHLCHILERESGHMHAFGHNFGTQRLQTFWLV